MMLTLGDFYHLGRILEGFFYGLYSGIFVMYLRYYASNNDTFQAKTFVFYALCVLYVLSMAVMILDIADVVIGEATMVSKIDSFSGTVFGCCDFISQLILIYRCWIMWGHDIRVVIIPLILTVTFLALWLSVGGSSIAVLGVLRWENIATQTSLAISMIVNALVTSLIVLKIIKVLRGVKASLGGRALDITGGRKLQSIVFILIESGIALFSIQLTRFVVAILPMDSTPLFLEEHYTLIVAIHQQLNGITPTIILVRVSMGLSFHDEDSLVEAAESLCFASNHSDSIPEIGGMNQEGRDDDIEVQLDNEISSEIEMVNR